MDKEEVRTIFTEKDIDYLVKNQHRAIIIFEGDVYDATDFKATHPGGPKFIDDNVGKDVTQAFYDADHSRIARRLLKETRIGTLASNLSGDSTSGDSDEQEKERYDEQLRHLIDPSKGTIYQVFTKLSLKQYIEYINDPKHLTRPGETMRMFDSPYLEIFSVTPWYLIPIVWVPVILYTISLARQSFGWPALGVMFVVGAFLWTLIEYCLHRFLFHLELFIPDNRYLYTLHYVLHGVHHAFPMDGGRLVMPPVLGIPYYYLLYGIFSSLISMEVCHGLAVGVIFAYVCYDLGHYYFHHEQPIKWMEYRKKYHMYHHYKDPDNGYGITTSLWDTVFGTTYKNFKNS